MPTLPADADPSPIVVLTTLGNRQQAAAFVRDLVAERLVACGTVIEGATSIYRWKGEVTEESEALVILKTTTARWASLQETVTAHHPYEVPELLALPVGSGLDPYLRWLADETE